MADSWSLSLIPQNLPGAALEPLRRVMIEGMSGVSVTIGIPVRNPDGNQLSYYQEL
jgi:hypothetical protein